MADENELDKAFGEWQKLPTPAMADHFLQVADPVLGQAMTSYAGRQNPVLKAKAKSLALGAIKTFDPKKGAKLRTHLLIQLQPLRREAVRTGQIIQMPERMVYERKTLDTARRTFMDEHDREPTDHEVADLTGLSLKRILTLRKAPSMMTTGQVGEYAPATESTSAADTWLEFVYHELRPEDKLILDWRLGRHDKPVLSTNDIASRLRLTPSAVSQRMSRIANRLQEGEGLEP